MLAKDSWKTVELISSAQYEYCTLHFLVINNCRVTNSPKFFQKGKQLLWSKIGFHELSSKLHHCHYYLFLLPLLLFLCGVNLSVAILLFFLENSLFSIVTAKMQFYMIPQVLQCPNLTFCQLQSLCTSDMISLNERYREFSWFSLMQSYRINNKFIKFPILPWIALSISCHY